MTRFIKKVDYCPKVATFKYTYIGSTLVHNYICGICGDQIATLNLGKLEPCLKCQKHGYVTCRLSKLELWWLKITGRI